MKVLKINKLNTSNTANINFKANPVIKNVRIKPKNDIFIKSKGLNMMEKFINLRENFSEKLYPLYLKSELSCWNFYINSTDENLQKYKTAQEEFFNLYKDEDFYKELLKIDETKLNPHEAKQLKNLKDSFKEELNAGDDLKELREKENNIAQKYNSYVPKIDNKEVSKTEITEILQKEKNVDLRKKAYEANIIGGDLIAEDLKDFAILRNNYARKKGYSNYFEYKLKDSYEVDLIELEKLLDDVYSKSSDLIKKYLTKEQENLKKVFGVDELKPYHYGYLSDDKPEKKVNDSFKTKEQIVEIAKKTYKGMGYNIDDLEKNGNITLDLFPRKNKNTHGFCFGIDAGADARILANLTNNTYSLETLNHELGHCVYTLGTVKELPFLDRDQYPAMTEAIAMMMQDLQKRENILDEYVNKDILEEYKKTFIEDELSFITKALTIINFEKEMYKNPEQDLKKLWHDVNVKYKNRSENEDLNNGWATIPHYLSHPAYYQNYFRATIIKAQIYNYLLSQLGNLTENTKTAEFLKENLFKLGMSLEENELIENLTGKKLSVDDFLKSLK